MQSQAGCNGSHCHQGKTARLAGRGVARHIGGRSAYIDNPLTQSREIAGRQSHGVGRAIAHITLGDLSGRRNEYHADIGVGIGGDAERSRFGGCEVEIRPTRRDAHAGCCGVDNQGQGSGGVGDIARYVSGGGGQLMRA